ncbi:murein transglycosylase [Cladophialophora psammophila CBS 110553]|uniref:Murein transglycosylase n=1 Tax=Cladophialophora psammophila CBS 110553 TaxID=1182543 RepID=W9XJS0_9EURO|nr:murein transglycosylase [Cladophialophora psammophila CBS 110553]EXJ70614.1 murein transglycosylase [Cladophialophora psammophila CBS 110553]
MTFSPLIAIALAIFATFLRPVSGDSSSACNPLNGPCPAIPGLATGEYFMDFTQQTTTPSDWILADYANVGYGPNGANFTFAKRYDAPYIWTRFYVLFGRIEVVVQAAPGAGIITSSVMMSDDLDEIDWEWSGNNFAGSSGAVQTNYFGKGQVGNSDRGSQPVVDDPEHKFHTYALDWQPDKLVWSIDGVAVRTLKNNGATTGSYQYPQTPSRLHLGLWCSGDPSTPYGTVYWGGGYTNFSAAPFSAYVKSVKITTNNVCSSWQYPSPFDGTYPSVQCTNQTIALPCTYTVVTGDDGSKIAKNLTVNFDSLKGVNPGVNWDQLLVGQVLNVPGGTCQTSTTTTMSATSGISSSMASSAKFSSTASFTSNLTNSMSASILKLDFFKPNSFINSASKLFKLAIFSESNNKCNNFGTTILEFHPRCHGNFYLSFDHGHLDYWHQLAYYGLHDSWRRRLRHRRHNNIVSSFSIHKLLHRGCRRLWLGYCERIGLLLG